MVSYASSFKLLNDQNLSASEGNPRVGVSGLALLPNESGKYQISYTVFKNWPVTTALISLVVLLMKKTISTL